MATAVLNQPVGDTSIKQPGCGAPMQHFAHRSTSFLMRRAVAVQQLDHGQPEDGRKVLAYGAPFVGQVDRRAIHEYGPYLLQLMYVRSEERVRIITTKTIRSVDRE